MAAGPFDIFSWYGMILAQGLAVVPFMFLLMSGAMRGMDPALEEASLVAGGGWLPHPDARHRYRCYARPC